MTGLGIEQRLMIPQREFTQFHTKSSIVIPLLSPSTIHKLHVYFGVVSLHANSLFTHHEVAQAQTSLAQQFFLQL